MSSSNLPRASLINALKWLGIVLVVPILPFLILGDAFEARVQQGIESVSSTSYLAALIITALSLDIFLPIPSSGVSTFAGQTLGLFWGTITSWVGMTVGACMGFATAKWLGKSVFKKYSSEDDQAALSQFGEQHGDILLIATRALPLLAEASVLLLGTTSYPWAKISAVGIAYEFNHFSVVCRIGRMGQCQQSRDPHFARKPVSPSRNCSNCAPVTPQQSPCKAMIKIQKCNTQNS